MTRINLVPPEELYDQHLIAEYREIRLLTANTRKSFASKSFSPTKIPKQFTLNKGHCLFFLDKGKYIQQRYNALQQEMRNRGFEPKFPILDISAWKPGYFNDWTPTEADMNIVRERIALRVSERPGWYRYNGIRLDESNNRTQYADSSNERSGKSIPTRMGS